MIIRTLLENKSFQEKLGSEHGLSLLIETKEATVLFDMGASDLFARNAKVMGVDLANVDLAVISHGHYDHTGGLQTFFEGNNQAPVYIHSAACGEFVTPGEDGWRYIGIPKTYAPEDRFIKVQGDVEISKSLKILAEVQPNHLNPPDNKVMFQKGPNGYELDRFIHEQNLVLRQGEKTVLITGCAHKGIVNIMDYFYQNEGKWPDVVIGGFHLVNREWSEEMVEFIGKIGEFFKSTPTHFYTGHCTGEKALRLLKNQLGNQIEELSTGMVLNLFD